jgi:hypothetical protein
LENIPSKDIRKPDLFEKVVITSEDTTEEIIKKMNTMIFSRNERGR